MYPVNIIEVENCLPHRPPMRWIDEIVNTKALVDEEEYIQCRLNLNRQAHYFNSDGYLRPTSFVEMIAQAYGYGFAYLQKEEGVSSGNVYIVGVEGRVIHADHMIFNEGDILNIFARKERSIRGVDFIRGFIKLNGQEQVLTDCQVRVKYDKASFS